MLKNILFLSKPHRPRFTHVPLRRRVLTSIIGGALSVTLLRPHQAEAKQIDTPIAQPRSPTDADFIKRAFVMRQFSVEKGDQAFGAVVVRDGLIIGQSWSRVVLDEDPTGHAEMSALRDAARRHGADSLSDATLYSSSRPCLMCEVAAAWCGVGEMIHGSDATSAGVPKLCR